MMLALLLLSVAELTMKFYILQEILLVLLVVGLAAFVLLCFATIFLLLQEGFRRAVSWVNSSFDRLKRLSGHQIGPQQPKVSGRDSGVQL
jgi:hypothetical protein